MVGVRGDPGRVEHQQSVGPNPVDGRDDVVDEGRQVDVGQATVAVVAQRDRPDAQDVRGGPQLVGAHGRQVRRVGTEGRCATTGEAQDVDARAGAGERVDHRAEAERLVVRVRDDREDALPVGQIRVRHVPPLPRPDLRDYTPWGIVPASRRPGGPTRMCSPAICNQCRKVTYSGCGMHVEQVLASVPTENRCTCR